MGISLIRSSRRGSNASALASTFRLPISVIERDALFFSSPPVPVQDGLQSLKVSASDIRGSESLLCGNVDQLCRTKGIRMIVVDRPGCGATPMVPLADRFKISSCVSQWCKISPMSADMGQYMYYRYWNSLTLIPDTSSLLRLGSSTYSTSLITYLVQSDGYAISS